MDEGPIAVARHRSDLGAWEMATRQAHPALRDHVSGYWGYRERTTGPLRRREVASTTVPLILSFGEPIDVSWPGHEATRHGLTSFVAGVHDRPVVTEHAGSQHGIEVLLTPLGAYTLLGVPMRELANTVVGVEDLLGDGAAKLIARLAETPTWDERLAMLDETLAARLAAGMQPSAEVTHAWRRLCQTGGGISVGGLAAELGWSRRHLVARFREQIGLPPKTIAKLIRFQRGLRLLTSDASPRRPGRSWAEVAHRCGYYDQAHLNRDFRALAGCTPTELLAARLPDGAGIAVA
jgi:AraC-like DNA-binding protein